MFCLNYFARVSQSLSTDKIFNGGQFSGFWDVASLHGEPRSLKKLSDHCSKMMTLHDGLADLKSYFDGHGDPTEEPLA